MPDDGIAEVLWVEEMLAAGGDSCTSTPPVAGIVAQCDLSLRHTEQYLQALIQASPRRLRGIRYILDYDGPYQQGDHNGTHVACSRHHLDYLRNPQASEAFAVGLGLLSKYNLSFDLQCAPAQLPAAVDLLKRYPHVRVCLNHMGKPQHLAIEKCPPSSTDEQDPDQIRSYVIPETTAQKLVVWRHGMQLLATLPQACVKLSMLGYAVPGNNAAQ